MDLFFDQLCAVTARIPRSEILIPCGDWNGHIGRAGTEYREVHGGMGYGRSEPDVEGERILEYALASDLLLVNTCFKKRDSHLITYKSRKENPQKPTQLSSRSHPRHLVGKRTAQKTPS